MSTLPQQAQYVGRPKAPEAAQLGVFAEDPPVAAGRGHDQQEVIDRVVAQLEQDAPFQRLGVMQPHLHFDCRPLRVIAQVGVPGAELGRPVRTLREWDLGPMAERRAHLVEHALQPLAVRRVAQRPPARIRSDPQLEPEHRTDPGSGDDREILRLGTLDLAVDRPGDAGRVGDVLLAQSGCQARIAELLGQLRQRSLAAYGAPVDGSHGDRHTPKHGKGGLPENHRGIHSDLFLGKSSATGLGRQRLRRAGSWSECSWAGQKRPVSRSRGPSGTDLEPKPVKFVVPRNRPGAAGGQPGAAPSCRPIVPPARYSGGNDEYLAGMRLYRAGSWPALTTGLLCLLLVGCTGMPTGTAGQAARAQLCNDSDAASLAGVAGQLDTIDTTDPTALQTQLGTALANLQSLQLQPAEQPLRDAAATAIQQLQGLLSDANARQEAARQAARALRLLHGEICE